MRAKYMTVALLLAAALTSCAGGDAGTERSAEGQTEAFAGAEGVGDTDTSGLQGNEMQRETPEGSIDTSMADNVPASVDGLTDADSEAIPEATPKPSIEPFVDRLTPEGVGWGLSFGESGEQPVGNASLEELAQYDAYFMDDGSEKVIYLTFDCGYENGNTEAILDALKAHDAPATFFVVGHFLETAPELVKRMVEDGHNVGNHTYHHYNIDSIEEETFKEELKSVEDLFYETTGTELSHFYRPPEGKCGITNLKLAQEQGYNTIFWSLAYVDWDTENQPSHEEALKKLTERVHPGAIVLLHNTSSTNGEILDELLTKWEEMGYTFAPLQSLAQ